MSRPAQGMSVVRAAAVLAASVVSIIACGWLVARATDSVSGNRNEAWIIGRATGVTSYLLLMVLVVTGMLLSHPWRTRVRRPTSVTRIRVHIALGLFTLAFTVTHIVVLATDRYAGVGWPGALLPMRSTYRPIPTSLGVACVWLGVLVGGTALLAARMPLRAWWPIHKIAALCLVLAWIHGIAGGGDHHALMPVYLGSGTVVLVVALSRYLTKTPADQVRELVQHR